MRHGDVRWPDLSALPPSAVRTADRLLCAEADEEDRAFLRPILTRFCELFGESLKDVEALPFYRITPDSRNPYKQLYVSN